MKPGKALIDPQGRRFVVGIQTGCDQQQRPMVKVHRRDRQKGEAMTLWRLVSEVEQWREDSEVRR